MVSTLAAQTIQGQATVVRIKGAARYSQGGTWSDLHVGDVLKPGAIVQTGLDKGCYVDLVLGDETTSAAAVPALAASPSPSDTSSINYRAQAEQNVVRLNSNTALGIDKLTSQNTGADVVTETQLDLRQGSIVGNVKKLTPASRYEIKLPNGVAGIRGTLFWLDSSGHLRVGVGSVVMAHVGPDGSVITQVVNGNQEYDAATQKLTPLAPEAMENLRLILNEVRAGSQVSSTTPFSMDQTVRRVSPSKGKGKGKGPPPF